MFQKSFFILLLFCCFACQSGKQLVKSSLLTTKKASDSRIAFYNVENLFDIYDDRGKSDEEFMPESKKKWTAKRYNKKLNDLTKVFSALEFPSLIGLCEVENKRVLEDLTKTEGMGSHGYEVVHFESPDFRGIDNALLYKSADFKVLDAQHYPINFPAKIVEDYTTRDILHVKGMFKNAHTIHLFVNHWPSRRGGLKESEPKRLFVAEQLKKQIDRVLKQEPDANIIVMGDFNDEPDNKSINKTLGALSPIGLTNVMNNVLYNCSYELDQEGLGTYNYRGNWNMLDQFIVSGTLLSKNAKLQTGSAMIFKADWLNYIDKKKGPTPNKTYGGPNYYGGYSDHYPIYMELYIQ